MAADLATTEPIPLLQQLSASVRADQLERLRLLTAARPGASRSDLVRDLLDLGFPIYERQQALLKELQERSS